MINFSNLKAKNKWTEMPKIWSNLIVLNSPFKNETFWANSLTDHGAWRQILETNKSHSFPSVCKNKQLTSFLPMNIAEDKKAPYRKSFAKENSYAIKVNLFHQISIS